ncbi:hypothetical protein Q5N85_20120, partial [Acinetobacter baumannii]|nr:hypothetical protein [Acinetobacter baumannii]
IVNYYKQHDDLSKKACQSHTVFFLQSMEHDIEGEQSRVNGSDTIKVVSDAESIYAIKNVSPIKEWACVEKWGMYNL